MIWMETLLIAIAIALSVLYLLKSFRVISKHIEEARSEKQLSILLMAIVLALLTWVVERSIITGHAPFSGVYESLVFFMFLFTVKITFLFSGQSEVKRWMLLAVMAFLSAALLLNPELKSVNLLVPALQSPWMYIHVPAFFVAYASLTFSFVLSLILQFTQRDVQPLLDQEMKQTVFFLTLGIITGAFWGEQAWGNFWNWDNKEIWALITWLISLVHFHIYTRKWRFWLVMAAFAALLFTYFGVMFILPGLHSYR